MHIFKNIFSKVLITGVLLVGVNACSTKKNTTTSRVYHNLTSYYNVYFNAKEAFKAGNKKIDNSYKENYAQILPVFKFSDKEAVMVSFGDMNRVIEKGSKCIRKHSIKAKPKRKEGRKSDEKYQEFYDQKEFVRWVDDSYLLIGKAHLYKHDFYAAIETFNYVVKEYSDKPIKYDGYLWLARTYLLMEKYDRALDFISRLEADKGKLPKDILGPMAVTQAEIQIQLKQYETAIPYIRTGIANTKNKKERVRYMYILAQLYQEIEEFKKAFEAYGDVADLNPDYEMTFNAKINRASIFNARAQDSKELQKELQKMLKDDKNIDYRDQIYYALGNIAANETRLNDAIGLYLTSAHASTQNTNQKGLSFVAAADIYFEKPDYRNSQTYYDSAVAFLSPEYANFEQIKNKSRNLNALIENIKIIEREDSLQRIANLSVADRNAVIDQIIQELIQKEIEAAELLAKQQLEGVALNQQQVPSGQAVGQWYFYNPAIIGNGQAEFKKKWGTRKNEDNWRRQNRTVIEWADINNEESTEEKKDENLLSNKTREYYMTDLPLTDSAKTVSNERIELAYFNMATLYKDKFQDFQLSIDGYNALLKAYPNTEYKLATYYNLYKLYFLNKNYKQAEIYKNLVITEFPDSENAKVLSDPEYFVRIEKIENQVNFLYQATYKYFINDNCDEVYYNYRFADTAYHESKLIPKFALLATLCSGHSGDTIAFKDSLTAFKNRYLGTDEALYANEVLAALDREKRVIVLEKTEVFGGELAGEINVDSIDVSMYTYNPTAPHYYMVVVANAKTDANSIKFNLSNFNIDYYSFLNFEVAELLISVEYTVVTTQKFKNSSMANNYFESVDIAAEVFGETDNDAYRKFIISQENYDLFIKDKNLLRYQKFFNDNYKIPNNQ